MLPGLVAAGVGSAAPLAYLVCALAMALIVACFALAGSRVSLTGGLYAYVEVAFGPFVGFLAGVLQWLVLCLSAASLLSAFADQLGQLVPAAGGGAGRVLTIALSATLLAAVNVRGVRAGAGLIEGLVVAKLLPLALFVGVGLFHVRPGALAWSGLPDGARLGETVLLLIFAFVGIEVALVPSGEVREPSRTVPRAVFLALGFTTLLYGAIQAVAQGVLGPSLAGQKTPLAEATALFLGPGGRLLVLGGGLVSAFGYLAGDMLSSPRTLYAFARDGFLPSALARVHSRFRTPHLAVVAHAAVIGALAVSSSFLHLALLANVGVLALYAFCCAGTWWLMRRDVRADGPPLRLPGQQALPFLALAVIAWILSHATARELLALLATLVGTALLYGLRRALARGGAARIARTGGSA